MRSKILCFMLVFSLGGVSRSEAIGYDSINRDHLIGGGVAVAAGALSFAVSVPIGLFAYQKLFAPVQLPEEPFKCTKIEGLSYDDFIGNDHVVNKVKECIKLLIEPEKRKEYGVKPLRGLLVDGAPRNGKTLLSKIIISELGVPVMEIGTKFFNKGVGLDPANMIKMIFSSAKEKALENNLVVFFKDLHTVKEVPNLQEIFIEQIKELDSENIFIICEVDSWNKDVEFYDAGVEKVLVTTPTREGRITLLKHFLKKHKLDEGVVEEDVASEWGRRAKFISSGDLENFVNYAASLALKQDCNGIKKEHLEQASLKATMGQVLPSRTTEKELRVVAYHEAGHAVADLYSGREVNQITIVPRGPALGSETSENESEYWSSLNKNDMLRVIIGGLGGYCAEKLVFGDVTGGPVGDLMKVNSLLYDLVCMRGGGDDDLEAAVIGPICADSTKEKFDHAVWKLRRQCLSATMTLLENHRDILDRLAEDLLEKGTLNQDQIYEIAGTPRDEVASLL